MLFDPKSITVNHASGVPLAEQINQQFIWLIASRQLHPGNRLPPVRELAKHLSININTVRTAYQRLEANGLVATRHGSGTQVLPINSNLLARLAGAVQTNTVGIIFPNMGNPFYQTFLQGVEEITHEQHIMLFICNMHDDPEELENSFAQLLAKHVDGIITVSCSVRGLLQEKSDGTPAIPLVTVDWPDCKENVVLLDLKNAGYQATRHLIEHGHRRIGLITFNQDLSNVLPINSGYEQALKEAGIKPEEKLIARVPGFEMNTGAQGMQTLLANSQPPTAIFAIADILALGAMQTIKASGLTIPEDIALTSFNDIAFAPLVEPPLTTVSAPTHRLGKEAIKMLLNLMKGAPLSKSKVLLPTSLIIRQSCGTH